MDNSRAIFQANSINQLNICAFIKFMIIKNNIHGPSLKMEEEHVWVGMEGFGVGKGG